MSKDKNLNETMDDLYVNLKNLGKEKYNKLKPLFDIKPMLDIDFINESKNPNPEYATDGASGFDLRANLEYGPITLKPLERRLIPTGLFFAIPLGYELQVRPRSGLALKSGVTVLNTPGTVDSDYRGEVGIILINLSDKEFTVEHSNRIAQGVIAKSEAKNHYNLTQKENLDETDRNTGGFGSTGVK